TKAKRGHVSQLDRFIERTYAKQRRYRAEKFITKRGRIFRNVGEHGRLVKVAAREFAIEFHSLSSRQYLRTSRNTNLHLIFQVLQNPLSRQRPNIRRFLNRISN